MTPYRKGRREEEALVRLFRAHGLPAERVPLSGAVARNRADLIVAGLSVSVKYGAKAPKGLCRHSPCFLGPYLAVPLAPLLAGWIRRGGELPRRPLPKAVAQELERVELLVAREKGGEWQVVGRPEHVFALGKEVGMYLSVDRIKQYIQAHGFSADEGFAERLIELAMEKLEEALERAKAEGRKDLRLSDLSAPKKKGKPKRTRPLGEEKKETLVMREQIRYRRPLTPVEREGRA